MFPVQMTAGAKAPDELCVVVNPPRGPFTQQMVAAEQLRQRISVSAAFYADGSCTLSINAITLAPRQWMADEPAANIDTRSKDATGSVVEGGAAPERWRCGSAAQTSISLLLDNTAAIRSGRVYCLAARQQSERPLPDNADACESAVLTGGEAPVVQASLNPRVESSLGAESGSASAAGDARRIDLFPGTLRVRDMPATEVAGTAPNSARGAFAMLRTELDGDALRLRCAR